MRNEMIVEVCEGGGVEVIAFAIMLEVESTWCFGYLEIWRQV